MLRHVKILTILLALAIVLPCQAEIGDTVDQAIERLGAPAQKSAVGDEGLSLEWKKDNLLIAYYFLHGDVVTAEQYTFAGPNRLSLDDARALVGDEMELSNWSEASFGSKVAWRNKTDHRGALYLYHPGHLDIIFDAGWVEANVHASALEWRQAMGLPLHQHPTVIAQ